MKVIGFLQTSLHNEHKQMLHDLCYHLKSKNIDATATDSHFYVDCDVAIVLLAYKRNAKDKKENFPHILKNEIIRKHGDKTILFVESPLLNRTVFTVNHSMYRVGLNHYLWGLADFKNNNSPSDRFNNLNIKIKPWRTQGKHILILGQNRSDASLSGTDITWWLHDTIKHIKRFTNRKIIVRDHPENRNLLRDFVLNECTNVSYSENEKLTDDLKNCHCVVSYTSGGSIEAIIEGIPVIPCNEHNFVWPISSHSLSDIENPKLGERQQLLYDIAYAQWSVKEISDGTAWAHLMEKQ